MHTPTSNSLTRALLTIAALALVAVGAIGGRAAIDSAPAHAAPLHAGDTTIAEVTESVLPSVVNISTTKAANSRGPAQFDPFFNDPRSPFGQRRPGNRYASSLGSGVIVSAEGYVLTNSHVVSNSDDIRVSLANGREFTAEIVGNDPKSDLAVLALQGDVGELTPIRFGRSSDMRLGEVVLAIGNPFGVGQTVTMGIVSAKGRSGIGIVDYEDFIQTDAAINPGNSGGALVNLRGELIGINTAILSRTGGYQGIGFAIPTDMAGPIMTSLIQTGTVKRGWLGVEIRTLDRRQVENMPAARGVLVTDVVPRSPAARAGLRKGDVIVSVDGTATQTASQLVNAVGMAGANKAVTLEVARGNSSQSVKVTLGDLARAAAKIRR